MLQPARFQKHNFCSVDKHSPFLVFHFSVSILFGKYLICKHDLCMIGATAASCKWPKQSQGGFCFYPQQLLVSRGKGNWLHKVSWSCFLDKGFSVVNSEFLLLLLFNIMLVFRNVATRMKKYLDSSMFQFLVLSVFSFDSLFSPVLFVDFFFTCLFYLFLLCTCFPWAHYLSFLVCVFTSHCSMLPCDFACVS